MVSIKKMKLNEIRLAVTILAVSSAHLSQGIQSSCEAPTVTLGETATVICKFSADFSSKTINFEIQHNTTSGLSTILSCTHYEDKRGCQKKSNYTLNESTPTQFILKIPSVNHTHAGEYRCQPDQTDVADVQACNLTVQDSHSSATQTSAMLHHNTTRNHSNREKTQSSTSAQQRSDGLCSSILIHVKEIPVMDWLVSGSTLTALIAVGCSGLIALILAIAILVFACSRKKMKPATIY